MYRLNLSLIFIVIININLFTSTNVNDTIPKLKISSYRVIIENMIKENRIEGVSVALFSNDSIIWAESFGTVKIIILILLVYDGVHGPSCPGHSARESRGY